MSELSPKNLSIPSHGMVLGEEEKSSFAKDLAWKAAKGGATTLAIAGTTAAARAAGSKIGTHVGDKIGDFVTGKNRRKKTKRKRRRKMSRRRRSNNRRSRRESVEEQLRQENQMLREALREAGVALVLSNHLDAIPASERKGFLESLGSPNNFERVVEFDEYVTDQVRVFLEERGDLDASKLQEAEDGKKEKEDDDDDDDDDEGGEEVEESVEEVTDPLNIMGEASGYIYQRIVIDDDE